MNGDALPQEVRQYEYRFGADRVKLRFRDYEVGAWVVRKPSMLRLVPEWLVDVRFREGASKT